MTMDERPTYQRDETREGPPRVTSEVLDHWGLTEESGRTTLVSPRVNEDKSPKGCRDGRRSEWSGQPLSTPS